MIHLPGGKTDPEAPAKCDGPAGIRRPHAGDSGAGDASMTVGIRLWGTRKAKQRFQGLALHSRGQHWAPLP